MTDQWTNTTQIHSGQVTVLPLQDTLRLRPAGLSSKKQLLANSMSALGIDRLGIKLQSVLTRGQHIRVVNYHGTTISNADSFRRQIEYFSKEFSTVSFSELQHFLCTGERPVAKPGIIITFDDGLRNNFDVAAPILNQCGFAGWFFIPTDFIDSPVPDQMRFASEHFISPTFDPSDHWDGRIAMNWDELRQLQHSHVVGCHTRTHQRMYGTLSAEQVANEIKTSKQILEDRLQAEVPSFAWVGGEEATYSQRAAQAIVDAGFELGFMTNNFPVIRATHPLQIQRTNIEASWPLELVRFQLSGFLDLMYTGKRRRVNAITETQMLRSA